MQKPLLALRARSVLFMIMCISLPALLIIPGCSGGGSTTVAKPEGTYKVGTFIDSPVEGLQYKSITWEGITDSQGGFYYQGGEDITFFIGDVVIGHTGSKGIITPVDLGGVASNTASTKVINISRFLLSLDQDGNPNNGITIPQRVRDALKGIRVDFSDTTLDNDAGVVKMFERLKGLGIYPEEVTGLVSVEEAQIHLENTINKIASEDEAEQEAIRNTRIHAMIGLPYSSVIMTQGQSMNLKGFVNYGEPPYTYSWLIGNEKPFSTRQSPGGLSFKNQGSYVLTFTATDNTKDSSSDVRHITVYGPETQEGPFERDSIPTVTITYPPDNTVFMAGTTVDFKAIIYNGNVPLYYGWGVGASPGNSSSLDSQSVVYLSPRTYMITQDITLTVPGTYTIAIAVKDTGIDGKGPDDHASRVMITVK